MNRKRIGILGSVGGLLGATLAPFIHPFYMFLIGMMYGITSTALWGE